MIVLLQPHHARKLFAVAAILVEIEGLHALAVAVLLFKINGEQALGIAAVGQQHDLVAVLQLPAPDDLVAVLYLHTAHPGGDAPLHRHAVEREADAQAAAGEQQQVVATGGGENCQQTVAVLHVYGGEFLAAHVVIRGGSAFHHALTGDEENVRQMPDVRHADARHPQRLLVVLQPGQNA